MVVSFDLKDHDKKSSKKVDKPGIEPGTPPIRGVLREYYTTKPYALLLLENWSYFLHIATMPRRGSDENPLRVS